MASQAPDTEEQKISDSRLGAAGYAFTRSPDAADRSMAAMTATEMIPFVATLREIQSSPVRSPIRADASAGGPTSVGVNRVAGVAMASASAQPRLGSAPVGARGLTGRRGAGAVNRSWRDVKGATNQTAVVVQAIDPIG